MSVNGIWIFEIAGIYGWERISTTFLEKGRYLSGGAIMFSHGVYTVKGKKFSAHVDVTQHNDKQTVFGEKRRTFSVELTAKYKEDKIEGKARLKGSKSTVAEYKFRLLRLAPLPAIPKK
ncbi:hypothetical protein [sulfur-oxidizing endosymbiont of Gigantopelta aegis]|uniref:hypothetical protein n=1 Tax=sulfur-oxidizing endosymbiont of Gigantopelta aegis TaxID=2794934 RepID=UPI0018DC6586|nr:hypothetical protein [sulfur-oxidizing endosymbiont of Gigantopelta aegis]